MSEMERAAALLGMVPQYKLGYAIAYLQGLIADGTAEQEEVPNTETVAAMNEILEMERNGSAMPFTGSTAELFAAILSSEED